MTQHFTWSDAQDAQIRRLRAEGESWESIAGVIGRVASVVRERGRRIGARRPPPDYLPPPEDPMREPLPAGDDRTWGAITKGTVLEGEPYPLPVFRR